MCGLRESLIAQSRKQYQTRYTKYKNRFKEVTKLANKTFRFKILCGPQDLASGKRIAYGTYELHSILYIRGKKGM